MKAAILGLIHIYRKFLSPTLPAVCRFYPSCSHYGHEAISEFGMIRGGWLAIWRVLRCHPFSVGGFDPVPHVWSDPSSQTDSGPLDCQQT